MAFLGGSSFYYKKKKIKKQGQIVFFINFFSPIFAFQITSKQFGFTQVSSHDRPGKTYCGVE